MIRILLAMIAGSLLCFGLPAQSQTAAQASGNSSTTASTTAQNGQANGWLASGTTFNAALNTTLDSKKCQPGDPVKAKTTEPAKSDGKTVLPKGTQLIGHVTQASARSKGAAESALGIVFDKAVLKNGQEIPLNVAIQAIASPQAAASMANEGMDSMGGGGSMVPGAGMGGGRGPLEGTAPAAGGAAGAVANTAANIGGAAGGAMHSAADAAGNMAGASRGSVGGLNAAGQLASNSQGVIGLQGLKLSAAGANGTQGNLITSTGKNVHLDNGTRMLLVAQGQTGRQQQGAGKQPGGGKPEAKPAPKTDPDPRNEQ